MNKLCNGCNENKSFANFHKNQTRTFGLYSLCKQCKSKKDKSYNLTPKKKFLSRGYSLKSRYNITQKNYDCMLKIQNGLCFLCGTSSPGGKKENFAVDHNKITGKVRKLLCHKCNTNFVGANTVKTSLAVHEYLKLFEEV